MQAMRWGIVLALCACAEDVVLEPLGSVPEPARPGTLVDTAPPEVATPPPITEADDPEDPPPIPDTEEPSLPDPALRGPHLVGVRTVEMRDPSRDRTFLVDVWYPAVPDAAGDPKIYAIETRLGVRLARLDGTAIEDAAVAEGPWPLVLFSHGYGGIRFQSFFLTEHLASHGYVVAAPDHPGNLLTDFTDLGSESATARSVVDRPLDVLFVRDALVADPGFEIDPGRVAMTGHSFGGWTTFEVGRRDPTIAAFVPFAPGFRNGATPAMAADLGRPLLIFGGSVDSTCPYLTDQLPAYEAALPPKGLLRIEGAGHLDFSNLCDIALARLFVDDGCDPDSIDPVEVQEITKTLTTAFLGRHLQGRAYELSPSGPVHFLSER